GETYPTRSGRSEFSASSGAGSQGFAVNCGVCTITLSRYSGRGQGEGLPLSSAARLPSPQPSPGVPGEGVIGTYDCAGAGLILALGIFPKRSPHFRCSASRVAG